VARLTDWTDPAFVAEVHEWLREEAARPDGWLCSLAAALPR